MLQKVQETPENDLENILIKATGDANKHTQLQLRHQKSIHLYNRGKKHNSRKENLKLLFAILYFFTK